VSVCLRVGQGPDLDLEFVWPADTFAAAESGAVVPVVKADFDQAGMAFVDGFQDRTVIGGVVVGGDHQTLAPVAEEASRWDGHGVVAPIRVTIPPSPVNAFPDMELG
jgi:hypothetical protein